MRRFIFLFVTLVVLPFYYMFMLAFICFSRWRVASRKGGRCRLVWGCAPIINNSYWARAMRAAGYESVTFTSGYPSSINKRSDYDYISEELYPNVHPKIGFILSFCRSILRYDVFFISFQGYFLGNTPFWWLESHFLKLAKKKIVVLPFGLDVYVYRRVKSMSLLHGLLTSVPMPVRKQSAIARRVDYWCKRADFIIPGFAGPDGLGRWDVLVPSSLFLDTAQWRPSGRSNMSNGVIGTVYVAHTPNHRGFKGSEFIIDAIEKLRAEGLKVELILIERMPNDEVKRVFFNQADILVEQLVAVGHGLNGLEGLASGLSVISNLEEEEYILPLRRWSYFSECPIVSASPETILDTLRKLVTRPDIRAKLSAAGPLYVEKYHSFDAAGVFFGAVIGQLYGLRESMISYCHPLLGEYVHRAPLVNHPLINGKLPN